MNFGVPTRTRLANEVGNSREQGLALVVVLWVVVSATLLVTTFNAMVKSGVSFVSSEVQLAKADALLDAGAEIAAARLIDEVESRRWPADGRRRTIAFAGSELTISIHDPNRLIDLNKADGDLLFSFFRHFTGSEAAAGNFRDEILRLREQTAARSAPARRYTRMNYRKTETPPAVPAFIDGAQLRHLPGMTPELYTRVSPFITVFSRNGSITPFGAPRETLLAIPHLTKIDVERLLATSRKDYESSGVIADIMQRAGTHLADNEGPAYVVSVELSAPSDEYRAGKLFVIATGLDNEAPYRLISSRPTALSY